MTHFSPPIPVRKKSNLSNPWTLKKSDLMSSSLPNSFLDNYFSTRNIPSEAHSNQNLDELYAEPRKMVKQLGHVSDPSVDKMPLSTFLKSRACSTISFTFEQHNLTYTPESTV